MSYYPKPHRYLGGYLPCGAVKVAAAYDPMTDRWWIAFEEYLTANAEALSGVPVSQVPKLCGAIILTKGDRDVLFVLASGPTPDDRKLGKLLGRSVTGFGLEPDERQAEIKREADRIVRAFEEQDHTRRSGAKLTSNIVAVVETAIRPALAELKAELEPQGHRLTVEEKGTPNLVAMQFYPASLDTHQILRAYRLPAVEVWLHDGLATVTTIGFCGPLRTRQRHEQEYALAEITPALAKAWFGQPIAAALEDLEEQAAAARPRR